jgi:hypothetical protein
MIHLLGAGQGGTEYLTDGADGLSLSPRGRWVVKSGDSHAHRMFIEAARRGAMVVESNEGFTAGLDDIPTDLPAYIPTEHTARHAMRLAAEHYGREPEFRYVTGFSGGGNRTINALERKSGIFHGGVGGAIATIDQGRMSWSLVADAAHVLRPVLDDVVANAEAGGSGDLYAGTRTADQKEALAGLYRVGYPLGNERALRSGISWVAGWGYLGFTDPEYVRDLFEIPGYRGHDGGIDRVRGEAEVVSAVDDEEGRGLRLDLDRSPSDLVGALLSIDEGPRAELTMLLTAEASGVLYAAPDLRPHNALAADFPQPGDSVRFDNSQWLALREYHRDIDRRPPPPRRGWSVPFTGSFDGKLLLLQPLHDHLAHTRAVTDYVDDVEEPGNLRFWWQENADHAPLESSSRYVDWNPAIYQAWDDLIAWVEDGVEPLPSSSFSSDDSGIVRLPSDASERGGIQPTVQVRLRGRRRALLPLGETATQEALAEAPRGSVISEIAWDLGGTDEWVDAELRPADNARSEVEFAATEPGTFLIGVRVRARRGSAAPLVENLTHIQISVPATSIGKEPLE